VVEPDAVDSLSDDVETPDSELEPPNTKTQIRPYRRAGPDVDNVKVFIHGHLRGQLTVFVRQRFVRNFFTTVGLSACSQDDSESCR